MNEEIVKWRIYCITEESWTEGWLSTNQEPVKCFNDHSHEVNINSIKKINQTYILQNKIVEEDRTTNGSRLVIKGISFEALPNQTTSYDFSWKYPVNILNVNINSVVGDDLGNCLCAFVSYNTAIGTTIKEVNSSSLDKTILEVSQSVIDNSFIGMEILFNGSVLGEIIEISTLSGTIKLSEEIEVTIPINSVISGHRTIIKDLALGYSRLQVLGANKIGASYLIENTKVQIKYKNIKTISRTCSLTIEYLY